MLKEVNPEYSLEGLVLKLRRQYFGHLMQKYKIPPAFWTQAGIFSCGAKSKGTAFLPFPCEEEEEGGVDCLRQKPK